MSYSASRILTWMSCPRKAAWTYFLGYPDFGNADTQFGQVVHSYLEELKKNPGMLPDETSEVGAVAARALPYVEDFDTSEDAKVEGEFIFSGRHTWVGYKDLSKPGATADYKTTGNFAYAKTEEDLLVDPQAVLYAEHAFRRDPQFSTIELRWVYLLKRAPYTVKIVTLHMTREQAAKGFAALESYADEMQAAANAAPVDLVERSKYVLNTISPNFAHCDAFRGCPHRSRCPDSPLFHPGRGKNTVNLLERMQALSASPAAPAPARPTLEAPPLPQAAPAPARPTLEAPPLPQAAPAAISMAAVFAGPGNAHPMTARSDIPADPEPTASGINPPARRPGRPPGSKNKPKEGDAPPVLAAANAARAEQLEDAAAARIMAPVPAPAAPVHTLCPASSSFAHPQGIPAPAAPALSPSAELAQSLAAPAPAPILSPSAYMAQSLAAPAPADEPYRLGVLMMGCTLRVRDGRVTDTLDFDEIAAKARAMVGDAAFFAGYGFKTNGMMLQAMQLVVQQLRPAKIIVVDPRTPEATLMASYLRGLADVVIEGRA